MGLLSTAWKNKKLILEGVINKVQAKEEVVKIANERKEICKKCPMHSSNAKKYLGYKTERIDDHCISCGCNLELKTHSLHSECPDKPQRWKAVVDEKENLTIQQYIKDESDSKE